MSSALGSSILMRITFILPIIVIATADPLVTHQVYFNVRKGSEDLGQIVIGLFGNDVPRTVENFYTIATKGINGQTYANIPFHRVIKKFMIQGGDIVNRNGTGSISIYGGQFDDERLDDLENLPATHDGPGYISMANSGRNTNGCQFFITTVRTPWLDGRHVVFGKVVIGQDVVHKVEQVRTDGYDAPLEPVYIAESGSIDTPEPFNINSRVYDYQPPDIPDEL